VGVARHGNAPLVGKRNSTCGGHGAWVRNGYLKTTEGRRPSGREWRNVKKTGCVFWDLIEEKKGDGFPVPNGPREGTVGAERRMDI